ncbi:MAG: response regulator [Burkholderiaceae bacterium]
MLVVDDSPTVRRQLTVAFDRMGISCEPVASAAEALARLVDEHFDLALVDVVMPDMDGYKLTREIKRSKRLRQIPVIILTSRSSPFDLARAALAGCDTYLTKPVPFRALEAAVLKQLRKALAIDDLAGLVRISAPPQETAPARPVASRVARLFGR